MVGIFLEYSIGREKPTNKPDSVTVDIVKGEDEILILIYEYYSGELIFEYNKNKELDKEVYREFADVWEEVENLTPKTFLSSSIE